MASNSVTPTPQQPAWVASWYAAPCWMPSLGLEGCTLRQVVQLHAGGEQLRLRLSNRYGRGPITLANITVGTAVHGPAIMGQSAEVCFDGQPTVTLASGKDKASDPIPISVQSFALLAITFMVVRGDCLTGHLVARQTSYISGRDNPALLRAEFAFMAFPHQSNSWWVVTGIDILPSGPLNALVALGSSTTDGFGSTLDGNGRWPDFLARRLHQTHSTSVINAGLSGNQLTGTELPQTGGTGIGGLLFGEAGQDRLLWDVIGQPGATDLIIHIGSNDLRLDVQASTIIEAFRTVVQRSRNTYKKIFGTTILPGSYTFEQARERRVVNEWIQNNEGHIFDAVFDLAYPLQDDVDMTKIKLQYDSGDGIHPNDAGYKLMAEAVDSSLLTGGRSS